MFEGPIILLPTLIVFMLAIYTHRPIESLLCGALVGLIMIYGAGFISAFAETSLRVMMDETMAWVILVCGFMGSLIGLLVSTGSLVTFANCIARIAKTRRHVLLLTWLMGIALFVDDYLNSMAVGSSMKRVTDKYRVSREKLAYVVDSTAAPISVIIPFSTWGVFFAGLIVANGIAPQGQGFDYYVSAIPYMLYAWIAVLLVPAVILGIVPLIGPMRSVENRLHKIETDNLLFNEDLSQMNEPEEQKENVRRRLFLFVIPMLVLVLATLYFDKDFLTGVYVSLGCTVIYVLGSRILSMDEAFNAVISGFKTMLEPLGVLFAAFVLKDVNDTLGMAPFIVESMIPFLTPELLPAAVFIVMALMSFMTGSNWGLFAIAIPIIAALGSSLDADMILIIGATLSAATFGSHACFYSDATVLTAHSTGCSPFEHAITQLPYAIIAAIIAIIGYLLLGYF